MGHHFIGRLALNSLIIISTVEIATKLLPMIVHNVFNRYQTAFRCIFILLGQNRQPCKNSPESILFSYVVRAGSETLLSTDGAFISIHEIAEEFPSGWGFVEWNAHVIGNIVQCSTCWHGSCNTLQSILKVWNALLCIRSNNSHRVRGCNEEIISQNHISVTISIGCSSKGWSIAGKHDIYQLLGVCQIWIWVASSKIFQWNTISNAVGRSSKSIHKQWFCISSSDGMHSIKNKLDIRPAHKLLQSIKIKDLLQGIKIFLCIIHHLDFKISKVSHTNR
mmetsp:Transcript_13320/g.26552  ORF Transcript_13320/g.26552 Transcript_13320/m.26552 type:complete len:278 (-) Transcript_13320:391-1224(-)